MRGSQHAIWITVENENPDLEDIANAQSDLEKMGINYHGKVGICFTPLQWCNFLRNLSRFENRLASAIPASVLGFPVRLIADRGH